MASHTITGIETSHFELSSTLARNDYVFISKAPSPATSIGNLTKPFSANLWLIIVVTLSSISFGVFMAYRMYSNLDMPIFIEKTEQAQFNLVLYPFCKVTEPEALPWFSRGTGGHLFVFSWTLFAWFMVLCYQSNLRAHLIYQEYEKPLQTLNDILFRTSKIWIGEVSAPSFL